MKVALYCRESDDDSNKAPPIENQIERGRQWAKEHNHEVVVVYADDGFSGGDWKRPYWNQSINDAKRHFYQVLWVWNQDRLARDTEQFLFYYRNLKDAKVKIWEDTSNEFIDMESLGGRVSRQGLAQASEIYRLVTSDKVKKAYIRKKQKGESWGRKKLLIDIVLVNKLRNEGQGYRTIAKSLNVSYQTIRRVLQNPHIDFASKNKLKSDVLQNNPIK